MKGKIALILLGLILIGLLGLLFSNSNRLKCDGQVGSDPELYYQKNYWSNMSISGYSCKIGNYTLDQLNYDVMVLERKRERLIAAEREQCYLAGRDYDFKFDLIEDYGFSCEQIGYINDHFILSSESKDGGSIDGRYSGFLSSGRIEGQFYDWVNTENLATGKIIKQTSYHLDCEDSMRDTKVVNYYSESDFIMYYSDHCLKNNPEKNE